MFPTFGVFLRFICIFAKSIKNFGTMRKMKSCRKAFVAMLLVALLSPAMTLANSKTSNPQSQTDSWYMVAEHAEGGNTIIPMSTVGSLVAVDDAYDFSVLNADGNVIAEKVMKVVFKTAEEIEPTAIHNISVLGDMLGNMVSDHLTLIGLSGKVSIFDASGKEQLSTVAHGGDTVLNIAHLPAGIYMVQCGKQTLKFMKK